MNLIEDFIPEKHSNRPGTHLSPTYLTIHETANTTSGANAEMHAKYLKGEDAQARQVSWHITVDDKKAFQHLPFSEIGWHAGREGNHTSIGIEICVNEDGDFDLATDNVISIILQLMNTYQIPLENVVSHQHWTGKNCPKNLLNNWTTFKEKIAANSSDKAQIEKVLHSKVKVKANTLWVYNKPDWNSRYKIVNKGEVFTIKNELNVNGSKMFELESGLFITGNPSYVDLT